MQNSCKIVFGDAGEDTFIIDYYATRLFISTLVLATTTTVRSEEPRKVGLICEIL